MGILHCIESGCAEVRYQPYQKTQKTGGIRYRYPGEDWVTVDGDDYSVETNDYKTYDIYIEYTQQIGGGESLFGRKCGDTALAVSQSPIYGKILNFEFRNYINFQNIQITGKTQYPNGRIYDFATSFFILDELGNSRGNPLRFYDGCSFRYMGKDVRNVQFLPRDDNSNYQTCLFKVFKNGEEIHQETRGSCPEVEIIEGECEKSDRYQVIKVEKQPYLQRIEVRDQDIQGYGIGGTLIDTSPLPEECLNIYKTLVTAPPFPNNTVPTAAIFNPYEFVAQICSDPGCPPPEYTVVCRCGEECPSGTCPVFCGAHVCCHDPNSGNSVYQIPLGEYSGGDQ